MYPIMLNVQDRLCVIIGGGKVALRKAKKISESGAKVKVISADFIDGFKNFTTVRKEYSASDIDNAFLVIAATNNRELNKQIAKDARKSNILVSLADNADYSDFTFPAFVTEGDMTFAVSTNGKFPLLAKKLCSEKSDDISFYNSLIPVLEKYRNIISDKDILEFMISDEMLKKAKENIALFEQAIKEKL